LSILDSSLDGIVASGCHCDANSEESDLLCECDHRYMLQSCVFQRGESIHPPPRQRNFWLALMKVKGYFRIAALSFALIILSVPIPGAGDFLSLLERKDPRTKDVITKPTLTRVLELPRLPVNSRQYEFLLDHPHLSMVLAHIYDSSLDLYKVKVRPDGLFHIDDAAGLAGDMEIVNSIPGRRAYFIYGHFDILKIRFHGHVVLLISYAERPDEAVSSVDSAAISYVKVNSAFVGFFAKIVAFLFPRKVDERIGRFATAVRKVSIAVHDDPERAYAKLEASAEVSPQELNEFAGIFLRRA